MGMVAARRLGRASHTDGRASRRFGSGPRGAGALVVAKARRARRAARARLLRWPTAIFRRPTRPCAPRSLHAPADELRRLSLIADALKGRFAQAEPLLRQAFNDDPRPDPLVAEALGADLSGILRLATRRYRAETLDAGRSAAVKPYLWRVEIDRRTGDTRAVEADYRAGAGAIRTNPKPGSVSPTRSARASQHGGG